MQNRMVNRQRLLLASVIVLLHVGPLAASAVGHDTTFAVTHNDQVFLRYYAVTDDFDSCSVIYRFGEIRQRTDGVFNRVYLDTLVKTDSMIVNDSYVTGVQSNLVPLLRSQKFYMSLTTDSITFYRTLQVSTFSVETGNNTALWKVEDSCDFTVQLVRASDDAVLKSWDSVGIAKSTTFDSTPPSYYWMTQTTTNPTYFIPYNVRVCSAYVRIVPRRFGPTPFGLAAHGFRQKYSLGPQDGYAVGSMSPEFMASAEDKLFEKVIAFYDTYFDANCTLPDDDHDFSTEHLDSIIRRYYEPRLGVVETDTFSLFVTKECEAEKRGAYHTDRSVKNAGFMHAQYGENTIKLSGRLTTSVNGEILIYNLNGRPVDQAIFHSGAGEFTFSVPGSKSPGLYIVMMRDYPSGLWVSAKLIVP